MSTNELLYRGVYEAVIQRIAGGDYPPGSMLPSEFDLAAELGVSQGTARKALIELERKGVLSRRQGRGTFVTLRTPENSLFHFFRLRDASGDQVQPKLEQEQIRRRLATKWERSALFGTPREVFEIRRVRSFEGRPLSFETSCVSCALFPGLAEQAPLPNTLYVFYQRNYSCIIISAEEKLKAGLLGPSHAEDYNLNPNTPVLRCDRKAFDLLDRVVELRRSKIITRSASYLVNLS